jgi:sirohydrochlorin ferrochelatase
MSETDKTTVRGKIGEQIFEQVEALVGAQHITRTEAFQRIAVERGSRAGTVAANYYRIARLRNDGTVRPRGRKKTQTNDADAVIARATTALNELTALVRQQSRELERLSEKVQQIEKLRALLAD